MILLYHRVAELDQDSWNLSVTPQRFAEHLEILTANATPVPLLDLLRQDCPPDGVALSFDDGYADNFLNAYSLLQQFGVPATFFLATNSLDSIREFWWDQLERIFLAPGSLPARLELMFGKTKEEFTLEHAEIYTKQEADRYRFWRAWEQAPTIRHSVYQDLYARIHPLHKLERDILISSLEQLTNTPCSARSTHRTLTLSQVRQLAADPRVQIGAHTESHPCLANLPPSDQLREIVQSKSFLDCLLRREVETFAYPYGRRCDYTSDTIGIVRNAGFSAACSNFEGPFDRSTDPFQLPRRQVQNWSGTEFARRLALWQHEQTSHLAYIN